MKSQMIIVNKQFDELKEIHREPFTRLLHKTFIYIHNYRFALLDGGGGGESERLEEEERSV
jgi:hypothetical protein